MGSPDTAISSRPKEPSRNARGALHRDWTTRDRAANVRLFRLASEILTAVEAGVLPPRIGWHCQDCPVRRRCWAWG